MLSHYMLLMLCFRGLPFKIIKFYIKFPNFLLLQYSHSSEIPLQTQNQKNAHEFMFLRCTFFKLFAT